MLISKPEKRKYFGVVSDKCTGLALHNVISLLTHYRQLISSLPPFLSTTVPT